LKRLLAYILSGLLMPVALILPVAAEEAFSADFSHPNRLSDFQLEGWDGTSILPGDGYLLSSGQLIHQPPYLMGGVCRRAFGGELSVSLSFRGPVQLHLFRDGLSLWSGSGLWLDLIPGGELLLFSSASPELPLARANLPGTTDSFTDLRLTLQGRALQVYIGDASAPLLQYDSLPDLPQEGYFGFRTVSGTAIRAFSLQPLREENLSSSPASASSIPIQEDAGSPALSSMPDGSSVADEPSEAISSAVSISTHLPAQSKTPHPLALALTVVGGVIVAASIILLIFRKGNSQ